MIDNTYTMPEDAGCENPNNACYLDDPYEGELFAVMMTLYSNL